MVQPTLRSFTKLLREVLIEAILTNTGDQLLF